MTWVQPHNVWDTLRIKKSTQFGLLAPTATCRTFMFWVSVCKNLFAECTLTQKENKNTKTSKWWLCASREYTLWTKFFETYTNHSQTTHTTNTQQTHNKQPSSWSSWIQTSSECGWQAAESIAAEDEPNQRFAHNNLNPVFGLGAAEDEPTLD